MDYFNIWRLYSNVMENDMKQNCVPEEAVRIGIESMSHVYKPATVSLNAGRSVVADYNDVAHRCAYMHKYAGLHTAMVRDMLSEAVHLNFEFFYKLVFTDNVFNICSLGGGPGSDIIGALAAFHAAFSFFNASVTVVDYMVNWSYSFESILKELGTGWYGAFGNNTSSYLNWRYVGANLLKSLTFDVNEAISSASFITMIKFASAAACLDTESMLKNIFAAMKPGACVLFIDNDAGGFHEIFFDAAKRFNFVSIFGPIRHRSYINEMMKAKKFGYMSCFKTTVTVHILQKPEVMPYHNPYNSPFRIPRRLSILGSPPHFLGSPPHFLGSPPHFLGSPPHFLGSPPHFLGSPPHFLGSPPTPLLYHAEGDIEDGFDRPQRFPLLRSPLMPYDGSGNIDFISPGRELSQSPYMAMALPSCIVAPDYVMNSPLNVNNENMRPAMFTPHSQIRHRRKNYQSCMPFKSWRHHIAGKVNKLKTRARSMFRKKIKNVKSHPIFKL